MQCVYEAEDEVLVLLEERAVVALARYALRASEVQVDGIAVGGCEFRGGEEVRWVVGAELYEEGAVDRGVAVEPGLCCVGPCGLEVRSPVFVFLREEPGVEHGCVGEEVGLFRGREVGSREHAPGLLKQTSVSYLFLGPVPVSSVWRETVGGGNTYKLGLVNHGRDNKLGTPNTLVERPSMKLSLNLTASRAGRLRPLAHSRETSSSSDKLRK